MTKSFLIRVASSTGVAALTLTMCFSAFAASNNYTSDSSTFSKKVSASDRTYVNQSMENSFNPSTNIVLNSEYYRSGSNYSLSTYYGCVSWNSAYPYRFARVRAYTGTTVRDSNYDYAAASDVTVDAHLDDKSYSSDITKVYFEGKSTVYGSLLYGLEGDCPMTCTLTF